MVNAKIAWIGDLRIDVEKRPAGDHILMVSATSMPKLYPSSINPFTETHVDIAILGDIIY